MPKKIDPSIRAMFKENARRIFSSDRAANRAGRSQNTIGEIERAMVEAYKLGQEGKVPPADNDVVDWLVIPPRSRDVLWYMTLSFSSFRSTPTFAADRLLLDEGSAKPRWFPVGDEGRSVNERGFLDGPVQKLVQLRLLMPSKTNERVLELTDLGKKTCVYYWERSDANDPSLPIMSVRA